MNKPGPDLSPLLPDDATLKARRSALVDAVGPGGQDPRPVAAWRRRGPRLALGAALALAAIAVALIVSAGGDNSSRAFAVEPQEGGGVTIKIYSLEDAAGLEQALEEAGIQIPGDVAAGRDRLPRTALHALDRAPSGWRILGGASMGGPGGPLTIGIGSTQRWRESSGNRRGEISARNSQCQPGPEGISPRSECGPLRDARPLRR